jgi:hypothetical protein
MYGVVCGRFSVPTRVGCQRSHPGGQTIDHTVLYHASSSRVGGRTVISAGTGSRAVPARFFDVSFRRGDEPLGSALTSDEGGLGWCRSGSEFVAIGAKVPRRPHSPPERASKGLRPCPDPGWSWWDGRIVPGQRDNHVSRGTWGFTAEGGRQRSRLRPRVNTGQEGGAKRAAERRASFRRRARLQRHGFVPTPLHVQEN